MIAGLTPKSMVLCFFGALVFYAAVFSAVEHWRTKDGPWKVQFNAHTTSEPYIEIEQEKLNIANLKLVFTGQTLGPTNLSQRVTFDQPQKDLPFGKRLHEDLVSLPGVETIEFFGHTIELFPRALRIDGTEHPWQSDTTIRVDAPPGESPF